MISATPEERVKILIEREKVSEKEALKILEKSDKERRKWAICFHNKDPWDLTMYDLSLVIGRVSVEAAVEEIITTVKLPAFQTTPESLRMLENQSLAARVKSDLMNFYHDVEVSVENHTVVVHIKRSLKMEEALTEDIQEIVRHIPGVKDVRVDVIPVY